MNHQRIKNSTFILLFLSLFSTLSLHAQLSGNYTIGGVSPTFTTITDALDSLSQTGVSGPVILNIRPGTYYEQFSIDSIAGLTATNTLTLKSETNNASDVVIQKDNALPLNYVMQMYYTNNIIVEHLTFTVLQAYCSFGTCDARVIYLRNVNDITIRDCILNGYNMGASSGYAEVIYALSSLYMNNISVLRNKINYGTVGFQMSSSSFATSNFVISDNDFFEQGGGAIGFGGAHNTDIITNNTIVNSASGYGNSGIDISSCSHTLKITGNIINIATSPWTSGTGVINLLGCYMPITDGGIINNNCIQVPYTYGVGIYVKACDNISFQHNNFQVPFGSIVVEGSGIQCNNIEIINNNFKTTNGRIIVATSITSMSTTLPNIDYNNYYIDGLGSIYSSSYLIRCVEESQALYGYDLHSISVNPFYVSSTDLHAQNILLNNAGINVGNLYDIDSVVRSLPTPTIGANEIFALAAPLAGVYSIGATGYFTSISQALDSLSKLGISNNVTFELQTGTYSTPIVLGKVAGLINPFYLTFRSQTANANDVILTSASTTPIVNLENTNNINFEYLTFKKISGSSIPGAITLLNDLKNIRFSNNIFNFNSGIDVLYSEINKCVNYLQTDSIVIDNNEFIIGRKVINFSGGNLNNQSLRTYITNNHFTGFNGDAITLKYQKSAVIENDSLNSNYSTSLTLIKCSENTRVSKNKIIGSMTGIKLDSCFSTPGNDAVVSNNFLNAGPPFGYGVYSLKLYNCTNQSIYHNSFSIFYDAMSFGGNTCLFSQTSSSCKVVNNIFKGKDWLFDIDTLDYFNYNNFDTPEPQIGRYAGTTYGTFASFVSGTGTNAQSIQINPMYTSSSDLHANNLGLKLPNYLATVPDDIDGIIRHTTHPFIGATEICKQPIASFASDTICFGDTAVFLNNSSNIDSLSVFYWDYENTGNTDTASLVDVSHYYPTPTAYFPELIIVNANGCSDTLSQTIIVNDTISFPVAFGSIISGDTVSFSDNTTNSTSWYWDFGDGFFSTNQNPTHTYSGPGSFYVCRTDMNNCATATFCDSVIILSTLSVTESFSDNNVILFPNPSTDKTSIIINNKNIGRVSIFLYNNLGELIYKKMDYCENRLDLDLSGLSNGVYQVQIINKRNHSILKKLIINK